MPCSVQPHTQHEMCANKKRVHDSYEYVLLDCLAQSYSSLPWLSKPIPNVLIKVNFEIYIADRKATTCI